MKKKIAVILPISIVILSVIVLTIYSNFSKYQQVTDYDSMISSPDSGFSLISDRSFSNNELKLTLPYKTLNGYLNQKKILSSIEASDFDIEALCFGNDGNIYLSVSKKDKKPVDLVARYQLSYDNDALLITLNSKQLGSTPAFLNQLNQLGYSLDSLTVPLRTKTTSFIDAYLLELLDEETVKSTLETTHKSRSLVLSFDFSELVLNYKNALPIGSLDITPAENTIIDGQKIVTYSQASLFKDAIGDTNSDALLSLTDMTGNFYGTQDGALLLRLTDDKSDFVVDLSLELTLSSVSPTDIPNLSVVSLEPIAHKTGLSEIDAIINSLDETLGEITASSLGRYKIKKIESDAQTITLSVDQTSWTIMVYMNGSDLESGYDPYNDSIAGQATKDLEEMIAGLNSDNINLIVETGGTSQWLMDSISPDTNQRFQIKNGSLNHLMDIGIQNMTAPETLIDFCDWTIKNYPSEKYALIFWDHGGGSLYGFGVDEYFPDDSLTLDEIGYALDAVKKDTQSGFEVVGFDACLMATLETAKVLEPYANFLIASEETEPDYGWDYERIFSQLADGAAFNGDSFGELIVSGFIDYSIEANQEELLTLSVIDLSKIDKVVTAMDDLFAAIESNMAEEAGYASIARIIPQIKAFGGNTEDTGFTDHYDIENFAKKSTENWPAQANKVIAALDTAVIYKASGYLATDAGGLSFYLPFYDLSLEDAIPDNYRPVAFSATYADFLDQYIPMRLSAAQENVSLDFYVDASVRPYQLVVDPASLSVLSDVFISVLIPYEDGDDYKYLDIGYDAWAFETDQPGVYEESFSYWPTLMEYFIPIHVTYYGTDYIEYETPIYLNGQSATLVTAWIFEESRYAIFGVRPNYEEIDGIVNLNTISLQEGDVVEMVYDVYSTQNESWGQEIQATFTVGSEPLEIIDYEFNSGTYGMYFVLQDYNGDITYSDYYDINY